MNCMLKSKAPQRLRIIKILIRKQREEQRLEAAQMKFLRHLLGITKQDKEKNQYME